MDWNPNMDEAPRDGSSILVATKDGRVGEASWWEAWYTDRSKQGWMVANCDEEYGDYLDATHWMPLPSPPHKEQSDE